MSDTIKNIRKEIEKKQVLLSRIERAIKNVNKEDVKIKDISKKDMLELLNATAGDEEFYEGEFEIVWCGYRCKLGYCATSHNALTNTIDEYIAEEEEC